MKKTFTKWLSFAVLAVLAGFGAVAYAIDDPADPSLAADVEELYAKEGETAVATIQLNQAGQKIYGVSADIVVPEGFDVEVEGTDADGITTSQTVLASGNIRVAVFSATPFDATITDVLTISVTPTEDDAEGELVLKSVVINYDVDGKPVDHSVDNIEIAVYEGLAPAKNLDFEDPAQEPVTKTTQGYQRNVTGDQLYGLQPVVGWTPIAEQTASDPGWTGGVFAYGSQNLLNNKVAAPATDPEGNADGNALGLAAVWAGIAQYTQTIVFEAGDYALQIPVYNGANTGAVEKNLIGVIINGEENFSTATTYPVGQWTNEFILFSLDEETEVTISLGFKGAGGSGSAPHLFIDEVKILTGEEYEAALLETKRAEALDYLETLPVSPDVFCYPEYIVEEALEEVADAESIEEIEAILEAVNASQILPYSDTTPYTIQQAVSGMYLNIASAAVTLSDQPQNLNLVATNSGYYITDGTRYVGLTSTNKWNMPTEPDLKTVIAIEPSIEGQNAVYTLGEANGFIGSDEVAANSKCYANKAADADNSKWIIKRAVTETYPVEVLTEEAVIANWTRTFLGTAQDGNFEVNTWSVEADASEVRTPFIQSWVWGGAGAKLSAMKIAHTTIENLVANGSYTVELTLRAYNEQAGSTSPSGLTITANDAAVDLADGQSFTYNNMAGMWDNFKLNATATADGKLDIAINIGTAETAPNMSWVAFKNLKITYNSPEAPAIEKEARRMNEATAEAQDAAVDFFEYYNTPETYKDALAAVANAKEVADFYAENGETIDALTDAAKEIFQPVEDESTDAAELAAALNKALKAQIQAGDDVTALVINNSFETGDLTGWTTTTSGDTGVKSGSTNPYTTDNCDGRYLFNTWNQDPVGYDIYQTITDMPAGKYKLIALTCGLIGANLDIFANDDAVTVTHESNNHFTETELEFELEEAGDITLGTKNATAWYKADNFRLIYLGAEEGPSTAISNIDKAAQKNGKFLENNTIVIYKNGKKFNLAGQAIQ